MQPCRKDTRELIGVAETYPGLPWPTQLIALLCQANEATRAARAAGLKALPGPPDNRERVKQTPAYNLIARLRDLMWLEEAYRRTRKDGAVGVDGVTAAASEERLQENLSALLERFKSGLYRAPPVRRVHLPKAGAKDRHGLDWSAFKRLLRRYPLPPARVVHSVYAT
jgi:hypothetical protein